MRVLAQAGIKWASDLAASKLVTTIDKLRKKPQSPTRKEESYAPINSQTKCFYARALKQLTEWMRKERRIENDPLSDFPMWSVQVDRGHPRRPLSDEVFSRLEHAAQVSERTIEGMTGYERAFLYRMARTTGPKQFFDLYPEEIKPPRIHPDDHDDLPAVGRAFAKIKDDKKFKQDKAWTKVRRAYPACISWADHNVGRVLDALGSSPYADNTIVVLWSDHGYGQGEKRHFRKFALWEETTKVLFIIWDTREKRTMTGREVRDGVSLINIYRTLADISGIEVPDHVDGFSLVPQFKDPQTPLPMPSVCSWGRGNYTIRGRDWRYTRYYDGGEELYSHADDPDEWTNLAHDPKHAAMKKRLASHLSEREVPIVREGLEGWSIPVSADNPLEKKTKSRARK